MTIIDNANGTRSSATENKACSQGTPIERYFRLRLTNLEGDLLFETDFPVDQFELLARQSISELVQQGVFRPNGCYHARIIPKIDDEPHFDQVSVREASEVPSGGSGFLDILFEQMEPPVDPVTYLTLQIRESESNNAYLWDLRLDTHLRELLARVVQTLLDDGTLKNGDRFRFYISAHNQGFPCIDPISAVKTSTVESPVSLREQDTEKKSIFPDDTGQTTSGSTTMEGEEIEIVIGSVEKLIKPKFKSMAAYADRESIGQISEQDIPIFLKRSAREQIYKSAAISSEVLEEVGGFLLGNVFRDPDSNRLYVEISQVVEADEAKGTVVSLDFNYNAWRQVVDYIDKGFPNMIPIGWYHTHLISRAVVLPVEGADEYIAEYKPFFSPADEFIHRNFFPNPWHVALVMDLRCGYEVFFVWHKGKISALRNFYVYGE